MRLKSQLPGQTDIAEALGISVSTVSRALSGSSLVRDAVRRQVEEKARELGYPLQKAAAARRLKDLVIGVRCISSRGLCLSLSRYGQKLVTLDQAAA